MAKTTSGALFYKGKRVAVMQGLQYTITTNDGLEITDGGSHNTDGRSTIKLMCNVLVPVKGVGVSFLKDALDHKDAQISLGIIDGQLHEISEARCEEADYTGEVASGKLTGKFTWHAGGDKLKLTAAPGV
jgi:hypothetical protein